jgi:biopolymer transport protein ExbD
MPKIKVSRKSVSLDMTAMCDMAFLLLTFFMLTAAFKPIEAVVVDTPSSYSQKIVPEANLMIISVRTDGAVFFGVDDQYTREQMLKSVADKNGVTFTPDEIREFMLMDAFGVPVSKLKSLLAVKPSERINVQQEGIPTDSLNNQLSQWIYGARIANREIRIAIKGDKLSNYEAVKNNIGTLQDQNINRFNLITAAKNKK